MTLAKIASLPEGSTPCDDLVLARLEDQIQWYDRKSSSCQKWYKRLKILTIVSASFISVLPAFVNSRYSSPVASGLAGLVAVIEGLQQLHQFHSNWISYRATSETLKQEKYLYLANAGQYVGSTNPRALLAERIESLVSREHGRWASSQPQAAPQSTVKQTST